MRCERQSDRQIEKYLVPLAALAPPTADQQQHTLQLPRREGGERAAVAGAQASQQRPIALPCAICRQDANCLCGSDDMLWGQCRCQYASMPVRRPASSGPRVIRRQASNRLRICQGQMQ